MKFLPLLFVLLLFSCAKEDAVPFDQQITYAEDFVIDPATGDTVYHILLPNAFTPNSDGVNDIYRVYGYGINPDEFNMRIFDRYDNMIFYTDELYRGWDGRLMGRSNILMRDVFTAKVNLADTMGNEHHYQYKVALMR